MSVIIPVLEDPEGVQHSVESLLQQTYATELFEIIVVDNGSTDDTLHVVESLRLHHPELIVVEQERNRSSYAARNRGIERARGEVLCFVDADMTVPPDYLQTVHDAFEKGADYLGCRVDLYAPRPTKAAQYDRAFGFPVQTYMRKNYFAPTCCLSVRRTVVESLGGFDARLESGGDLEFGGRVRAAGFRQQYAPNIALRHPTRTSFWALLRKARRTARGLAQLHYYHPGRYNDVVRRLVTWRVYAPTRPRTIQGRYEAVGVRLSIGAALLISLWSLPLRWVRPVAFLGEILRLTWFSKSERGTEGRNAELSIDRTVPR